MNAIDAEHDLTRLRDAIDRVDEVIVRLLNQRAKYAIEIGELKGLLGLPIYAPEREKDVLQHVERISEGPLDPVTVRRLFERIIDESRRAKGNAHGNEGVEEHRSRRDRHRADGGGSPPLARRRIRH